MAVGVGALLTFGYHPVLQPYQFGFTIVNGTVLSYKHASTPCPVCVRYETRCDFVCARNDRTCRNALCRDLCDDGVGKRTFNCQTCIIVVAVPSRSGFSSIYTFRTDEVFPEARGKTSCGDTHYEKRPAVTLFLDNATGLLLNQKTLVTRVVAAYVLILVTVLLLVVRVLLTYCVRRPRRPEYGAHDNEAVYVDTDTDTDADTWKPSYFMGTKVE